MKKIRTYPAMFLVIAATACNSGTTTTSTSDSSSLRPGDSSVTTTTTTTVTHHPYTGHFIPQETVKYLDLRTNKKITVRIDTAKGSLVNTENNEPLDEDLLVEPVKHDTIYAKTGDVVNNYIIKDDSGHRVDTVRINTVEVRTVEGTPQAPEKSKTKEKGNKTKTKEK
jgi:hypothetical protein